MERDTEHWQARLPETLHHEVVWPVRVRTLHDDGVPVSKWHGFDALGLLCWVGHRHTQWSAPLDDDDPAHKLLLREEEFEAWRSLLGTWVRRVQRVDAASGAHSDTGFQIVTGREIPRL